MTGMVDLSIDDILARVDEMSGWQDERIAKQAQAVADELLAMGEVVLESWHVAHEQTPTNATHEGFRLLALHRQAARGNPGFNACRETCRELVYRRNLIVHDPAAGEVVRTARLAMMVLRHLAFFISGKLQEAGLGEFCCSSRAIRNAGNVAEAIRTA